jgi:hypothetical protein
MTSNLLLAEGISDWLPWYTWVCMGLLVAILIGYRMYQKKMMS